MKRHDPWTVMGVLCIARDPTDNPAAGAKSTFLQADFPLLAMNF
jgi:hypothetical protein